MDGRASRLGFALSLAWTSARLLSVPHTTLTVVSPPHHWDQVDVLVSAAGQAHGFCTVVVFRVGRHEQCLRRCPYTEGNIAKQHHFRSGVAAAY